MGGPGQVDHFYADVQTIPGVNYSQTRRNLHDSTFQLKYDKRQIDRGPGPLRRFMMDRHLTALIRRYPDLSELVPVLNEVFCLWRDSFAAGNKSLICGNGGSASDSEHIVGELMKGFLLRRPVDSAFLDKATAQFGEHGNYLASNLQGALPAISLTSQQSLLTAFANDVAFDMAYAQQVYGYGQPGDVLVALSTSGNAQNVVHAVQVAKLRSLVTIGFTGRDGGKLAGLCDVTIQVPEDETYRIQERHIAIYHTLCIMLEETFFGECLQEVNA